MNEQNKSQGGVVWMLSTFALIGILVGLGISSLNGGSTGQTNIVNPSGNTGNTGTAANDQNYETPTVDDDAVLGSEDAPVTVIMFSEYQCPYCQRFEADTFPQIKTDFIDTGLIKLVYRDFPLSFHANAHAAAEAAECAGDSDLYWEYQAALINNYDGWAEVSDVQSILIGYGNELGIDISACLADGTYYDEVENDISDGRAAGVQGTPSFFINGEFVVGALPYEDFTGQDGSLQDGFKTILTKAVEAAK